MSVCSTAEFVSGTCFGVCAFARVVFAFALDTVLVLTTGCALCVASRLVAFAIHTNFLTGTFCVDSTVLAIDTLACDTTLCAVGAFHVQAWVIDTDGAVETDTVVFTRTALTWCFHTGGLGWVCGDVTHFVGFTCCSCCCAGFFLASAVHTDFACCTCHTSTRLDAFSVIWTRLRREHRGHRHKRSCHKYHPYNTVQRPNIWGIGPHIRGPYRP